MNAENDDTLEQEVKEFLSDNLSIPAHKLNADDSLFHNYGIDGDDAIELLQEFSQKFKVAIDSECLSSYFGPETTSLTQIAKSLLSGAYRKEMPRLTVQDLIDSVKTGQLKLD